MRILILILAAIATTVGCSRTVPPDPKPAVISVGQAWPAARETAQKAHYELHDASQLEMEPMPDGFYLNLPGNCALIVLRDAKSNTVKSMTWAEHWPGPKASRVYHDVDIYGLPIRRPE